MLSRIALPLFLATVFLAPAHAGELEGDQLYRVSTVQAAAGSLPDLLDSIALRRTSERAPLVMRHSQGDHWDLMIIVAIDHESATDPGYLAPSSHLIAFEEDHYAYGPPWADVSTAYMENSFYHIEMFEAVAGKAEELLEQRRMENVYLSATGLKPNMIFRRAAGSDVDAFTIGFHKDMEAFAAPSDVSDEDKEAAAINAGFKARSDISFYLRTLISGHHDTLAVRVD